ncbi:DUF1552 domain-containing protein [Lignipirellula cremea]|uniref:DUF1552 domain-containing protein n=1 Tax=Lignipirellula cremea TaxID=2528010 RepID=A0A518DRI0_9BACT|nr:DUF1552 domain-containing protein [Lignipirellula cremea]QDU94432.1 hypothetical protein Pla8534_22220 [Lignipirellula cremea]
MHAQLNRRQVLRAGAAVLALPWLESLARGQEAGPPQRIINVCTSFGLYGPSFFPKSAGREYESSEYLQVLGDLRDQFTVFSGISHPEIGGDHASEACFLTTAKHPTQPGFRNTVSMDVVASQHVAGATRFPLMTLSTQDGSPLSYTPTGAGIPALSRPSQIYANMFLAGGKNDVAKELDRLRRGRSMLDRMRERLAALSRTVSPYDQQQIADYTEAVRNLEKQLVAEEQWVHQPKPTVDYPQPNENYPSPFSDRSNSIGRARILMDLAKLAVQTDSTRVVSIFIKGMDEKPPIDGVSEGHHGLSHHGRNPEKIAQLKIIEKEKVTAFRDFLASLRDTREAGGSLLDSTQVLIGSNLGDASGHGTSNLPVLLAGGGYRHGQHIAGDVQNNTPLGKVFVNMLQRFGVETDQFGSGSGTINGLV